MSDTKRSVAKASAAAAMLALALDSGAAVVSGNCTVGGSEGCGTIGNFVWNDLNGNGLQDVGEAGVNGITVNLYQQLFAPGFSLYLTTTTSGGGLYGFTNVPNGNGSYDYFLEFTGLPSGFAFTAQDAGNDALDSDANPSNGRTASFSIPFSTDTVIVLNDYDAGIREVPAPGALALLGLGAVGLFAALGRRGSGDGRTRTAAGTASWPADRRRIDRD